MSVLRLLAIPAVLALLLVALVGTSSASHAPNLITNGSFETGTTSGWATGDGGVDVVSGWVAADGTYSVDVNAI